MQDDPFFPATAMPDPDWWSVLWPDPAAVLASAGLGSCMDAVDLCCGDGRFTPAMARLAAPGRVFALDLDFGMLDRARKAVTAELGNDVVVGWLEGDARDLPALLPHPVDFIFMANTFHGVPDKPGLAAAMCRSLRPGGRCVIVNWHALPREETVLLGAPRGPRTELRMSPEALLAAVRPAGLVCKAIRDVGPWHYAAVLMPDDEGVTG